MKRGSKLGYIIVGLFALTAMLSILAWADSSVPYGIRAITVIQAETSNPATYTPDDVEAEAGNVTELSLVAIATTKTWQGYYGNISGQITLEDAQGNVFYNWTSLEPKGEIYASVNNSISWDSIVCFNWTGQAIDVEGEEARYGITDDQADGIDETFASIGLDKNFFVGSRNITGVSEADGVECKTTNTFQYGLQGVSDQFENVLLTDGAGALVFTTVIENNDANNATDINGFDDAPHDFQLLVAEDGHDGQEDTTTTYYFWAEIE
jgi:hypothetical protein